MLRVGDDAGCGVRRTSRGDPERLLKEDRNMTDPNTTDDAPIRTWTRMDIPKPEVPDGVTPDPFGFFSNENGDSDD